MVQVKALIKGVNDEIIELIDESSIFAVDSVKDLINTLFRALIMNINTSNFWIFNNTVINVISSVKINLQKNILSFELIPFNSNQELLLEKWSLELCRNVIKELKNLELKVV